jgi:dTDP-4-dehydrorhamnose reductase
MKKHKTRVLITGASGFMGWNLVRMLHGRFHLLGTCFRHKVNLPGCKAIYLDITDQEMVCRSLKQEDVDVIVHTAAMTSPDDCERNREEATRINVEGTANLADWALGKGVRLIYVSSDLVFDGRKGWYTESDVPNPTNHYGKTKLEGEMTVRARCSDWLILRPSILYGWGSGVSSSFVDWLLNGLREGKSVGLFKDQFRTFLYLGDLARGLTRLLTSDISNEVIHIGGRDRLSRVAFGERFAQQFGFPRHLIRAISINDLSDYAVRGHDCSLRTVRLQELGFSPSSLSEGLAAMEKDEVRPL